MGRAKIKENLGEGHYLVALDIDVSYGKKVYDEHMAYLAELQPKVDEAKQSRDDLKIAYDEAGVEIKDYLTPLQAASEAAYAEMIVAYDAWLFAVQHEPDSQAISDAQKAMTDANKAFIDAHDALIAFWDVEPEIYQGPDWPVLVQIRSDKETLLGSAQSTWEGTRGPSLDPPAVALASDAMFAALVDFDVATDTYVKIITEQEPGDLAVAKSAMNYYKTAFEDSRTAWIKAVTDTTASNATKTLKGRYDAKVEAFQTAQKAMSATLNDGSMPPGLSERFQKMQEAEQRWRTADLKYRELLLIKTERVNAAGVLRGRLMNFYAIDGEGVISDPIDQPANAWCADATEDLPIGTTVATIEIPGERMEAIKVRPGYQSRYEYDHYRDGILQPTWASSPEATFYNWAIHPGGQKWNPNYRKATILEIDQDTNKAKVRLESQHNSQMSKAPDGRTFDLNSPYKESIDNAGEQQLSFPNPNISLEEGFTVIKDVPVEYMECNGAAFEVNDVVIVEFSNRKWETPKVIGFWENPKPCIADSIFCTSDYAGGESLQYKGAVGADYEHSSYKFNHSPPNLEGGNIDWRGADGTVLTWNGPLGRTIATRFWNFAYNWDEDAFLDQVGPNVHSVDYTIYKVKYRTDITGIHDVNHIRTEGMGGFLFMSRFTSSLYRKGKLYARAPGLDDILGAGIITSKDEQNKPIKLLVVATCLNPYSVTFLNDAPDVKVLKIYVCNVTGDIHNPYSPNWHLVTSYDFGEKGLPPVHNVFFSNDGLKFVTLWPKWRMPYHYGVDYQDPEAIQSECSIVRGTLAVNGETVTGTILVHEQTPYDWNDSSIHKSAVIGIDLKGTNEVTLTATYDRSHVLRDPGNENPELARDLSSITQTMTWVGSDAVTYASSTQNVSEIYFQSSTTDYKWGSTSTDNVDRPLYIDLRSGVCVKVNYASHEEAYLYGAAYIDDIPAGGTTRDATINSTMKIVDLTGRIFYQNTYNTTDQTSEVPSGGLFQGAARALLRSIFCEHGPLTQAYGRERPYNGEAVTSMAFDCAISPFPSPVFDNQDVMHTINDYIPNGVKAVDLYFGGYRSVIDKNGNCLFWFDQNLAHAVPMLTSDNTLTYGGYSWCAYPLFSTNAQSYNPRIRVLFATKTNAESAWATHLQTKHPEEEIQTAIEARVIPRFCL